MSNIYQYPLKVDKELIDSLREIADLEGRSLNKQIEYIIRQYLKTYAQENNQ